MRVIYIDVLLLMNFYITYFLVVGCSCLIHKKIPFKRRLMASGVGALTSLAIFLPKMWAVLSFTFKLLFSMMIVLSAWGFGGLKSFLSNTAFFFLINCVYGGVMLGLWLFICPDGMFYNNGVSYFDIPLWAALAATAVSYFIIRLIRKIMDSKTALDKKYTVEIFTAKGSVTLSAVADSGNKLTDFFTGLPVIFCDKALCAGICPDEVLYQLASDTPLAENVRGIRLIPCSTVSGSVTAVCFRPKKIVIDDGEKRKEVEALAGFTPTGLNGTQAIFNPAIL